MNTDFPKLALASLFAISALAGAGCAAIEHNAQEGDTVQGEDAIRSRATWFRVKASSAPAFSYLVIAADLATIACPGSTARAVCNVNVVDFSALRMPADDVAEIDTLARAGDLLIQGRLSAVGGQVRLTVANAYEDVMASSSGAHFFDKSCNHAYVSPDTGGRYRRRDRLMGLPYNDIVGSWGRLETNPNIIMDARDLVLDGLGSTKGLLTCMTEDGTQWKFSAVLLNVKDTYAP